MMLNASIPFALLLAVWPAAGAAHAPSTQVPAAARERLSALVPIPPPAKAAAQGQAAFYDASSLWEYINGAADAFQGYDVQAVYHRRFKAGGIDITVDIFDMGSLENAFGMYAAERSPKCEVVATGAEGCRSRGALNFFQHRYYVKLIGFGDGADLPLQQFASAISERIGTGKTFPPLLSRLPETQRKPRTERYLRQDPLGHRFLGPAFQAVFAIDGGERTLMVSVGASAEDAAARMKSLEAHFRRTGRWDPAPEFGAGAVRGSNSFEGTLVATVRARYVVILLNPSPGSAAFFKSAVTRLR